MRAVITVIGKDMVGILASVSSLCAKSGMNIVEVTQSILQDLFAMILMVEITDKAVPFHTFSAEMEKLSQETGLSIHVMHEDIFNSMHRI